MQFVQTIVKYGTRLWVCCAPGGDTSLDEDADPNQALNTITFASLAIGSDERLEEKYLQVGGSNATYTSPSAGNHSRAYRGTQLPALRPGLIPTLNG